MTNMFKQFKNLFFVVVVVFNICGSKMTSVEANHPPTFLFSNTPLVMHIYNNLS